MEIERRNFEISRLLNMVKEKGWEETSQRLEREKMFVSVRKDITGTPGHTRRLALEDLESIVGVFGWEVESSSLEENAAQATLLKSLVVEVVPEGGPETLESP